MDDTTGDDEKNELEERQRAQCNVEREQAPEAKYLEDAEYDRLYNMSTTDFLLEPMAVRSKFFSTNKWHFGQRQGIPSLQGMTVGGRSVEEILSEHPDPEPVV